VVNPRSWNKIPGQFEVRTTIWNITASDVTALLSLQTNITGCLARDKLAMLRFKLDLPGSPTQYQFKKLHLCTTQTWFHITWQFCNENNLVLKDTLPSPLLLRQPA
jgi:hypothetical protein